MEKVEIQKVMIADIEQLQQISQLTFIETFAALNSKEDMEKYIKESLSKEKLMAELSQHSSCFYFAILNGTVIGYLKLNFGQSQTELKGENSLEIERIYVLKAFHGKRVGQLFYEKAIQVAWQAKMEYVWLGVWEKNPRAIAFYKKNGFIEFDKHIFKLGSDEQTDILMKLPL